MNFRHDINGLRAVAVVAVIIFHFNPNWLPGGFVGVDVFFVISGYLMTAIIFRGMEEGGFSTFRFYAARARRIFPALAALCAVLVVFGFFFVIPKDYDLLAKHASHSLLFISNFTYFNESGYFDTSSHEKWLLHTWSLATEWQFYMIYPLLVVAAYKLAGRNAAKLMVAVLTVLSFAASLYSSYHWPVGAFYLFPARAWEMLIGGIAFLWPLKARDSTRLVIAYAGWVTIITACLFINDTYVWPGSLALIPVLGTYAVLQANSRDWLFSRNPMTQWIGTCSYSLYLWHWPIIVGGAYLQIIPSIPAMLGLLIVCSVTSYYLLEKRRISLPAALTASTAIVVLNLTVLATQGGGKSNVRSIQA